ncbi:MAG: hypothetical protein M5U28_12370 [Sandaracinaceae bacterium]|nr:hypothetical protein [Sandaracinaceae bacterium]
MDELERVVVLDGAPRVLSHESQGRVMAGAPLPLLFDAPVSLAALRTELLAYEIGGGQRSLPLALSIAAAQPERGFRVDVRLGRALEPGARVGIALAPRYLPWGGSSPGVVGYELAPRPHVEGIACAEGAAYAGQCTHHESPGQVIDIGPALRLLASARLEGASAANVRVSPPLRELRVRLAPHGPPQGPAHRGRGRVGPDQVYEVRVSGLRTEAGEPLRALPPLAVRSSGHPPQIRVSAGRLTYERDAEPALSFAAIHPSASDVLYRGVPAGEELRALVSPATYVREGGQASPLAPLAPDARPNRWGRGRYAWRAQRGPRGADGRRGLPAGPSRDTAAQHTAFVQATDLGVTVRANAGGLLVWVTRLSSAEPVRGARVTVADAQARTLTEATTDADGVARIDVEGSPLAVTHAVRVVAGADRAALLLDPRRAVIPAAMGLTPGAPSGDLVATVLTDRGAYRPGEGCTRRSSCAAWRARAPARCGPGASWRASTRPRAWRPSRSGRSRPRATAPRAWTSTSRAPRSSASGASRWRRRSARGALGAVDVRVAEYRQPTFPRRRGRGGRARPRGRHGADGRLGDLPLRRAGDERPPRLVAGARRRRSVPRALVALRVRGGRRGRRLRDHRRRRGGARPERRRPPRAARRARGARAHQRDPRGRGHRRGGPHARRAALLRGVPGGGGGGRAARPRVDRARRAARARGRRHRSRGRAGRRAGHRGARGARGLALVVGVVGELARSARRELPAPARPAARRGAPLRAALGGRARALRLHARAPRHLRARGRGARSEGRAHLASRRVYVAGPDEQPDRDPPGAPVAVTPTRARWTVGETAELAFESPFERAEALVTVEREGVLHVERRSVGAGGQVIRIPIREDMIPNVAVGVTLVAPRTGPPGERIDLGAPDLRFGVAELTVAPRTMGLTVTLEAPSSARPGSEVPIAVRVTDAEGRPVAGEVALWAVDEGTLRLTGYQVPDPTSGLFRPRPLAFAWDDLRRALVSRAPLPPVPAPSGDGGEGQARRTLDDRERFDPTPLWLPALHTDAQGRARATLTLPERPTEYRVMAVAIDAGARSGRASSQLVAEQPLVIRPALPRFVTAGDRFEASVFVHNATDAPLEARVSVTVGGERRGARAITIPAGGEVRVAEPVTAPAEGPLAIRFDAEAAGEGTAVRGEVPVAPRGRFVRSQIVAAAEGSRELAVGLPEGTPRAGGRVGVTVASHPFVGLEGAVEALTGSPWAGVEATASALLGLCAYAELAVGGIPEAEVVARGRARAGELLALGTVDGGFGRWSAYDAALPRETALGVHALACARERGWLAEDTTLERARERLAALATGAAFADWYGEAGLDESAYALRVLADLEAPGARPRRRAPRAARAPLSLWPRAARHGPRRERRALRHAGGRRRTAGARHPRGRGAGSGGHPLRRAERAHPRRGARGREPLPGGPRARRRARRSAPRPPRRMVGSTLGRLAGDGAGALGPLGLRAPLPLGARARRPTSRSTAPRCRPSRAAAAAPTSRCPSRRCSAAIACACAAATTARSSSRSTDATPCRSASTTRSRAAAAPRCTACTRRPTDGASRTEPRSRSARLVRVRLFVHTEETSPEVVLVRDPLPAGFEAVDAADETSPREALMALMGTSADDEVVDARAHHAVRALGSIAHRAFLTEAASFYLERLPTGLAEYTYAMRAVTVGEFTAPPAQLEAMYDPAYVARSAVARLRVVEPDSR